MPQAPRRSAMAGAAGSLLFAGVARAQGPIRPGRANALQDESRTCILGARNPASEAKNPDFLTPPPIDHGTLPNLR